MTSPRPASNVPGAAALCLLLALALFSVRAAGAQAAPRPILIRNVTVMPASSEPIEGGSVLIRGGKIAAVGKDVVAPPEAEIVEGQGKYLTPGIIDCHSHIAVSGGVNEGTLSVTSMVGVGDVLNPEDINIFRDLAGGVTAASVLHGSANTIGGKNQVIKLRWGKDAEGLKLAGAPPGIKFALGENPKRSGANGRYPATRMGVEDVLRDAFHRAREYSRGWKDYEAKREQGLPALPPRRDLELEPLVEVLQGKRLVHCHCYRSDEILMLIRLAEEFGFRVATFQHVLEGYKVAKEIAAHGAGASTFSDWWAYKIEAYDAIPYNAAIMTRKGVVVSINSDSAEEARHLNQEAAKCIRYGGLTETEALALVTLNPAKQLGIAGRVGSIERGKDADLVLFDRHPFSPAALPQKVWIDGEQYFDRERELQRQAQVTEEKRKLREQESGGARTGTPPPAEPKAPPGASPKAAAGGAPPASPTTPGAPTYAIRGARLYPVSGPPIDTGNIVVSGGRIAAIGKDARIPSGAQVIDGRGLRVYPGMIDADTTMGLTEIGSIDETSDTTDLGELKPQLRAYDAVHPESEHIPVTRVSGVTTALALPSGGIFCGHAALLNLDGWTVEEMAVRKSAGLVAVIPSPNTFAGFSLQTLSMLRRSLSEARREADVQAKRAVDLLDDARHYRQAREAREKDASLPPVRHDEKLEALQPVLRREVPVLARANSRAAIRAAVEFAQKQGLRLVIVGGASAGKMTPYLKEKDVGVIYGPVQRLPEAEDDPYDLPYATPGILARAGVRFAIATGDTSNSRNLAFDAGTALGSGLSETEAVRAVTLSPAELLGVADQLGSLEVGKLANLVVTIGDLLEIRSEVRHLFIRGRPIPLESRHTRLWDRYRARP